MSLLDYYWKLASNNPTERVSAAESLLDGLQANQNEEDWNYALKRLVRGMSSSHGSARLGFSMALAELLRLRSSNITVPQYLAICEQSFQISSSMKGAEERGLLLGRLFALQTLAKSPLWENVQTSSSDFLQFSTIIIDLSLRKAWLREPSFFALCELVKQIKSIEKYQDGLRQTFKLVHDKGLSLSCEGLALALSVSKDQRMQFNQSQDWKFGDPIHPDNLNQLRRTLKEMPVIAGDVSSNKPYIHFVWSLLLVEFCKTQTLVEPAAKKRKMKTGSTENNTNSIADLWNVIVDKDFFGSDTSPERKMWGFEIFLLWASNNELPEVVPLISVNFVKTLANQLANKDRSLHKICKKVENLITKELPERRPREIVRIISKFMSFSPNFDKISKSKLIGDLLASVSNADFSDLIALLLKTLKEPETDFVKKQWILDNLVTLVRISLSACATNSPTSISPMSWIGDIFEALIPLAYFIPKSINADENHKELDKVGANSDADEEKDSNEQNKSAESLEDRLAKVAQERIMSILSCTLGKSAHQMSPDPQSSWPYIVFQLILKFKQDHPESEPRVEFDEETSRVKTKAENTLMKIHKKRNSSRHVDSCELQAFELLFAMVLLQIYGSAPDAVSMLDELQMCYQKMSSNRRDQTEGERMDTETEENDPSAVLTEILISLLSQHSLVLRKLSEDVWRTFSGQFSERSVTLLCDILAVQENSDGQKSLFDVEEEEEDSEPNLYSDEYMDEENSGNAEDDETDGQVSDCESSSDYELDEPAKKKLAGALGVDHQISDDGNSSSEESMDDEQMLALDVHLATIFRERHKQKTKAKELRAENLRAKRNIVQLKGRVLDLLAIYLASQPSNIFGLVCIEPLLRFIKHTKEPTYAEKAREILKTRLCRKTSYVLTSEKDVNKCLSLLRKVHVLAAESKTKVLSLAANQVSVFLSKLIISFDPKFVAAVSDVYSASLQQWFIQSSNQITPNLFIDFVNYLDTKRKSS